VSGGLSILIVYVGEFVVITFVFKEFFGSVENLVFLVGS